MRDTKRSGLRHVAITCLFAALMTLWAPAAFSQTMTTGDIVGTVTDASSAVVPKATVTAKLISENQVRTEITDNNGRFRFSLMPPGDYEMEAAATGLKSKIEKFTLINGAETSINMALSVQGTQQTVEVQGQASILQTENANLTTGFNTNQVVNLPMNGGDLTTIAFTVPGILVLPGGGAAGNMNANGVPGAAIMYTLNGADDMDPYLNINSSGPSNNLLGSNEIAEASVILNAYSADYGRMAGAQVNYVGKTGTNSYHGNLMYNYNDAIFNANDFFNNASGTPRSRSDANNYGGSFGGPIKKNKLFFFVNYESLRYALPTSGIVTIPSPQLEQYALAHVDAAALPLYNDAIALWNNALGVSRAVPTTNGGGILQDPNDHLGCGTQTFATSGTIAPGGGVFGVSVPCSEKWGTSASEVNTEQLFTIRTDYNINDKQKISFRFNYDWGLQATAPSVISPTFNSQSNQPSSQGQMTYTYVISPNLVNNFVGSGTWYAAVFGVADFAKTTALMPESISISDGGFTSVGAGFPNGRDVGGLQLVDDLTYIHGKHTFKTGINYRFSKVTDSSIASGAYKGTYSFADLTDFVTGEVNSTGKGSTFTQSFPDIYAAHVRLSSLGAYAQDEYKPIRNLTLTLGFRFEHSGNPACLDNCFSRMDTQFGTAGYVGGANVPYNQTITTGLHNQFQSLQLGISEPRFGFAWQPFKDSKTVVRGGIGLFASLFAGDTAESVFDNAPAKFSPSVTFGEVGLPTDTASSAYAALASYNIFKSQFAQGATLTGIQSALGKIAFTAPPFYSTPNNFVAPEVTEWSVEVERTLTSHNVLAITYAGNHSFNQPLSDSDANAFLSLTNGVNKYYGASFGGLPTVQPDPRFLKVTDILTQGYTNYDAMTTQIRHAFSYGFQGQFGFTWAHDLGDTSVYNPYNLAFGYGDASIDVRTAFVSDLVWQEPHKFANKFANAVLGGWNFGAKLYIYGGRPASSSDSKIASQINSDGTVGTTFLATALQPLPQVCGVIQGSGHSPCYTASEFETYNSTSGVATPVQTNFGETGPGIFRGPDYFDLDTQISKKFFIKEHMNFEFGAQFFNTLNHPNFSTPSVSVTSGAIGTIAADLAPPTSIYGSGQGAIVTGRVMVVMGKFNF
jgi:hypothetical protein